MSKTIQVRLFQSFNNNRDKIAIEYGSKMVTYQELDQLSNQIANWIRSRYEKGSFIGVLMHDRSQFITTMIGIMKAGCVFVPFEASFPKKRIETMIEALDLPLTICDEQVSRFGHHSMTAISEILHLTEGLDQKPDLEYGEADAVYVYHTSGTTGKPKAIVGKNISLLHFILWETKTFGVTDAFRFSQFTNVGFDVFLRDTLVALCSGAVLCIPEDSEIILNSKKLIEWIEDNQIQFIHCVPSVFDQFNSPNLEQTSFMELKYILLAGEKVRPDSLRNWYGRVGERVQLVNLYGPSETTLAKTFYLIQTEDQDKKIVPIGQAIDGAQLVILNEDLNLCDEFETGEIHIRTPYMTHGYYNNSQLNNERFIPNPFHNGHDELLYKTGDLGRMLPGGDIELLGRIDRQIKIRGIRIEAEEIESVIAGHMDIAEAVVVTKQLTETSQFLYAYVTLGQAVRDKDHEEVIERLMSDLAEELPSYMLPSYVIVIDEVPRKVNGKIDYGLLRDPLEELTDIVQPSDETEHQLLSVWREILDIQEISVEETFFEKGGNSLSLMNLIFRISEEFQVEFSIEQIAIENTIQRQAAFIRNANRQSIIIEIPIAEKKDAYMCSAAQRRMYYGQKMDPQSTKNNLTLAAEIKGSVDRDRLKQALIKLLQRHESLRTSFEIQNDTFVQVIHDDFELEIVDVMIQANDESVREEIQRLIQPFDLSKAPLIRVFLAEQSSNHYFVIFDVHHIIFDGSSQTIFFEEFIALYNGRELPPMRIQYKDYAIWQNSDWMREQRKNQEEFWLQQFKGRFPVLSLPEKQGAKQLTVNDADFVQLEVSGELYERLIRISNQNETTLFTVLLTVCEVVLSKVCSTEDIVVGFPTSGRTQTDLNNVIGMFVNTIMLRNYATSSKSFTEFLNEVKYSILKSLENQDYQFDQLVQVLRKNTSDPKFDVMCQMQEKPNTDYSLLGVDISIKEINLTSEFKLVFNFTKYEDHFNLKLIYQSAYFERETIFLIADVFKQVLEVISENQYILLKELGTDQVEELQKLENNKKDLEIDFRF